MTKGRVLLLGAGGFIGRHIAFGLRASGWQVVACTRNTKRLVEMGFETAFADLTDPMFHSPTTWANHVTGITHIVNATTLLHGPEDTMTAIHTLGPMALYAALPEGVQGVLISGLDIHGDTPLAKHRRDGEALALAAKLTVLRPGLVLGDTSYCALPFAPLTDSGHAPTNPLHASDLAIAVGELLQNPSAHPLDLGGTETITHAQMHASYRAWLGLAPARTLPIPPQITPKIRAALSRLSGTSTQSLPQLADNEAALEHLTHPPRAFSDFLWSRPANTQDLWQARLSLFKPALRLKLAFMWTLGGIIALFTPTADILAPFTNTSLPTETSVALTRSSAILSFILAAALLRNWHPKPTAYAQIALIAGATIAFTFISPSLWLLPFGGLLKNLPLLLLLIIHLSLLEER